MPTPLEAPNDFSWHDSYVGSEADSVPDMINETSDLVRDMLEEARDKSDDALQVARTAITELKDAKLPNQLPQPPAAPNLVTNFGASLGFNPPSGPPELGRIIPRSFQDFDPEDIEIPEVLDELGEYVPVITGLTIPQAPNFTLPIAPAAPSIDIEIDTPERPVASYGEVPQLLELNMPTYTAPVLPTFGAEAPEFTDVAPDPFVNWTEPEYSSEVKDAVKAVLTEMLAGGTGLPDDVERAIWERARGRLDAASAKKIDELRSGFAARGFSFPPGMLNAAIAAALDEANQKANEQSMEIAVEQAKLEQQNRQFAVQQGIGYEQVFVNLFVQLVDRNFQMAKFAVESQIQIFNAKVAAFTARNTAFMAKVEQYKAELEGVFAYLRAFEAQVKAEAAKGEINEQQLRAYVAKVQAYNAQVETFKSLIQAEGIRVDAEKTKIDAYRGEIDAYVAKINGQRAAFEAYGSRVQAEAAKANLEEANARAYSARVQGVAAKAEVAIKRAEAQIQNNRLQLDWAVANIRHIEVLTGQELATIQANASAFEAMTRRESAKFDADRSMKQVEIQTIIEGNRNIIARYQASLEAWKAQAQHILAIAGLSAESIKAAGSIAGTLAAGAMAGTSVSAGISGSASAGQSKSEQTNRSRSFQQSVDDRSSYSVNHNYNHEV